MNTSKFRLRQTILFILTSAIVSATIIYFLRIRLVPNTIPVVKQIGAVQIRIKNDTLIISSKLLVINKSFLGIHIDRMRCKVSLHEKTYLQCGKSIGMKLSGHGNETIGFSLNIPYKGILRDLYTEREKGDSTTYSIQVSLVYSTIIGPIEIPIKKLVTFKLPQPPELRILDIKYKKVNPQYIIAEAKIKITNYSALTLSIKELSYSMNFLRKGNLKGNFKETIIIEPQENTIVNLPIEINASNIGQKNFSSIMLEDDYDYTLTLNAIMDLKNPLKESYHIKIRKNGLMVMN